MRITLVTRPDAGLYLGGGEITVLRIHETMQKLGLESEIFTPLTQRVGDIVHLFGLYDSHWSTADRARRGGAKIVWSPIFSSKYSEAQERRRRMRHLVVQRFPRLLGKLYESADALVYSAPRESRHAAGYFGATRKRVEILPNGVEPRFWQGDAERFRRSTGIVSPFVLHVGAFSPTKNQLSLVNALRKTDAHVVFIGRVFEPEVLQACKQRASERMHFITDLPPDDPMLPDAYAAANVLCVPSFNETFLMAAVEAGAAGCGIIVGNGWNAEEVLGNYADQVLPSDEGAIRAACLGALTGRPKDDRQAFFQQRYSWERSVRQLEALYRSL